MTHLQHYKRIVEDIFGQGTCTLDQASASSNVVIAALAPGSHYDRFRRNFLARLNRLHRAYDGHHSQRALLTQVNLVGDSKNWQGAVAELAAFDFFNVKRDFLAESPMLDVNIDPVRSLASKFGLQRANLDVHFCDFDVYTDIKVLKDNVSELLNGIYRDIWPTARPLIHSEYSIDSDYEIIREQRSTIRELLANAVNGNAHPTVIDCSRAVHGLTFRLDWHHDWLVTESTYSPYRHAEEHHKLPFRHAKKFVMDRPFFLTFVTFTWFNNVISNFRGADITFYRSLARRVFCQYKQDITTFSSCCPEFSGADTVFQVSRYLGGLLFLEDNVILAEAADNTNVTGFYYENPNGLLPPSRGMMGEYFHGVDLSEFERFTYDNY